MYRQNRASHTMEEMHEYIESDGEDDDFKPVQPWDLRDAGNALYREGKYKEAIEMWLRSLKESLKQSCRMPSAQLYENQLLCRLNMSMAYLKLEDWVEAKEQAQLVLEQRPSHVKALFRLAQALEQLQDWSRCGKTLQSLVDIARKAIGDAETTGENPRAAVVAQPSAYGEEDGNGVVNLENECPVDLAGYQPDQILKLVAQMRNRIIQARAEYAEKETKLLRGIGEHLAEIWTSPSADTAAPCSEQPNVALKEDAVKLSKDAFLGADPAKVVQWDHQKCRQVSDAEQLSTVQTGAKVNALRGSVSPLSLTADKVFKDTAVDVNEDDDPRNPLWTSAHDAEFFKFDQRPTTLSLPFSVAYLIQLGLTMRKAEANGGGTSTETHFTEADWNDSGPLCQFQRRLMDALCNRSQLTVHILGARGDVEMESHWTALIRRIPSLKLLRIVFVGFVDPDDRWSRSLREGVISPPLTKTQGLTNGQRVTCWLYKGLYQLFLTEHLNVLVDPAHEFHPDLVLVSEPRLARYFDSWIPVVQKLLDANIPIAFTGYSAVDVATHDAANLPVVLKELKARWVVPMQPNLYRVQVKPDASLPPMPLWTPQGDAPAEYSGISAKHAVVGCVMGYDDQQEEAASQLASVEELKSSLRKRCDVESESSQYAAMCREKEVFQVNSVIGDPTKHLKRVM